MKRSSLCWAFVTATIVHGCSETFHFLWDIRFPYKNDQKDMYMTVGLFIGFIAFVILSCLVVIYRFYDMSDILHKRAFNAAASIYTGRLLNEHVIYKNETDFLKKKYVLRQAQAIQIYGVVQQVEFYKQQGIEPNMDVINQEVKASCQMLKGEMRDQ